MVDLDLLVSDKINSFRAMKKNDIDPIFFGESVDSAIREDLGFSRDITSLIIPQNRTDKFSIVAKADCVLSGLNVFSYIINKFSSIKFDLHFQDGQFVKNGESIASGNGSTREILIFERVCLNYLQHLSGVATLTNEFVKKIHGTKAKICDTRKTIPGMRYLQKYAVVCGGGNNHRFTLSDCVLIKDNHIKSLGSIKSALSEAVKATPHYSKIIVECESLDDVKTAVDFNVGVIMLDNMDLDNIGRSVDIINSKCLIEVSGGVNLDNVHGIAKLGVDYISIGRITHSVQAIDISLDIS